MYGQRQHSFLHHHHQNRHHRHSHFQQAYGNNNNSIINGEDDEDDDVIVYYRERGSSGGGGGGGDYDDVLLLSQQHSQVSTNATKSSASRLHHSYYLPPRNSQPPSVQEQSLQPMISRQERQRRRRIRRQQRQQQIIQQQQQLLLHEQENYSDKEGNTAWSDDEQELVRQRQSSTIVLQDTFASLQALLQSQKENHSQEHQSFNQKQKQHQQERHQVAPLLDETQDDDVYDKDKNNNNNNGVVDNDDVEEVQDEEGPLFITARKKNLITEYNNDNNDGKNKSDNDSDGIYDEDIEDGDNDSNSTPSPKTSSNRRKEALREVLRQLEQADTPPPKTNALFQDPTQESRLFSWKHRDMSPPDSPQQRHNQHQQQQKQEGLEAPPSSPANEEYQPQPPATDISHGQSITEQQKQQYPMTEITKHEHHSPKQSQILSMNANDSPDFVLHDHDDDDDEQEQEGMEARYRIYRNNSESVKVRLFTKNEKTKRSRRTPDHAEEHRSRNSNINNGYNKRVRAPSGHPATNNNLVPGSKAKSLSRPPFGRLSSSQKISSPQDRNVVVNTKPNNYINNKSTIQQNDPQTILAVNPSRSCIVGSRPASWAQTTTSARPKLLAKPSDLAAATRRQRRNKQSLFVRSMMKRQPSGEGHEAARRLFHSNNSDNNNKDNKQQQERQQSSSFLVPQPKKAKLDPKSINFAPPFAKAKTKKLSPDVEDDISVPSTGEANATTSTNFLTGTNASSAAASRELSLVPSRKSYSSVLAPQGDKQQQQQRRQRRIINTKNTGRLSRKLGNLRSQLTMDCLRMDHQKYCETMPPTSNPRSKYKYCDVFILTHGTWDAKAKHRTVLGIVSQGNDCNKDNNLSPFYAWICLTKQMTMPMEKIRIFNYLLVPCPQPTEIPTTTAPKMHLPDEFQVSKENNWCRHVMICTQLTESCASVSGPADAVSVAK